MASDKWQVANGKLIMENGKWIMDNGELWNVFKIIASGDKSIFHFQFSIIILLRWQTKMNLKSGKHYKAKLLAIYPASLKSKKEDEVNYCLR